ncbi:MAG: divalent-cation tolerance protein CutA [Candidatus Omnitrophica bacterium]|nr:divalent-cation tolerance protein CutA [Candidatus Omnitrophota bacterium]
MDAENIVVFITAKDVEQADKIARRLLGKKLVACVNTVGSITSQYWWEGEIQKDTESLLIIKSRQELFHEIEKEVKALHSYSVPEIIAVPIIDGNPDYLDWIKETVEQK